MTRDEWKKIDQALSGIFGTAKLNVDGYEIDLNKGQISKNRLGIMVYVNGWFRGAWTIKEENHFEINFMRPREKNLWPKKDHKKLKKIGIKNAGEKIVVYDPVFNSVDQIRRHYEKTFSNIQLIKINGAEVRQ